MMWRWVEGDPAWLDLFVAMDLYTLRACMQWPSPAPLVLLPMRAITLVASSVIALGHRLS
eukprot:COSAG02_NODE_17_length_55377_cov_106.402258_5_plen_60_part_00